VHVSQAVVHALGAEAEQDGGGRQDQEQRQPETKVAVVSCLRWCQSMTLRIIELNQDIGLA